MGILYLNLLCLYSIFMLINYKIELIYYDKIFLKLDL